MAILLVCVCGLFVMCKLLLFLSLSFLNLYFCIVFFKVELIVGVFMLFKDFCLFLSKRDVGIQVLVTELVAIFCLLCY